LLHQEVQKTAQKDIDLGAKRYAQAKKDYEEQTGKGSRS